MFGGAAYILEIKGFCMGIFIKILLRKYGRVKKGKSHFAGLRKILMLAIVELIAEWMK
jgi:hypothetical protein